MAARSRCVVRDGRDFVTNILALMTDQHRVDTLGCYGNEICRTPALDRLAADGTRFTEAFTPTAICTPSRATLVSGVLPFRHGLLANYERNVGYSEEPDDRYPPFSAPLRAAGYDLGHVGKWHVGRTTGPSELGFDGVHYPGWGNAVDHPDYLAYLEQHDLPKFSLQSEVRGTFPNHQPGNLLAGRLDQPVQATFEYYLAERTIERLREHSRTGRPFYLACHWFGPHLPYCLPDAYYDMYDPADVVLPASITEDFAGKPKVQEHYSDHWTVDSFSLDEWRKLIAVYWGYVTLIDEQVGRVLDALDDLGLADDTAVTFTADHGEFTGAHRLHDKGPAMYDDIYRIPLLARIPGGVGGHVEGRIATLTDLPATFCDLAGVDVPDYYDGRSLVPILRGDEVSDWPDVFVGEFHGHHFPYPQRMLRTPEAKLVINPPDVNELYDLVADPNEMVNRYDDPAYAEVRESMLARLYTELRDRGDNFYHWMTSMYEVGEKTYDTSLSSMDKIAADPGPPPDPAS